MKTLKFKTSINCGGCVATVTPFLDKTKGILKWSVDTADPQKVLTVLIDGIEEKDIIDILEEAGYMGETLPE